MCTCMHLFRRVERCVQFNERSFHGARKTVGDRLVNKFDVGTPRGGALGHLNMCKEDIHIVRRGNIYNREKETYTCTYACLSVYRVNRTWGRPPTPDSVKGTDRYTKIETYIYIYIYMHVWSVLRYESLQLTNSTYARHAGAPLDT